jgi:hypothetical protein
VTQTITVTVDEVLPRPETRYPEFDRLWADDVLDVVVVWGQIGHGGPIREDENWLRADNFCAYLVDGGFAECGTDSCDARPDCGRWCAAGYLGRRFVKALGETGRAARVDVFHPDLFHSVADRSRFDNWQRAVSEHEVVIYNGHSVLGSGIAYEQAEYPDFYQIFMVFSCLSYSYYVYPIFEGKGGWEQVDVIANADLGKTYEIVPMTSHLINGLMRGFTTGGGVSWQDIMAAIWRDCHDSRPGVSGVTGNCFSPQGDLCDPEPDPDPDALRYPGGSDLPIEDQGEIVDTVEIPPDESVRIGSLRVALTVEHTYIGDLEITLAHGDRVVHLWDRTGGSEDRIEATFDRDEFAGEDSAGAWILSIADHAAADEGTLKAWALVIQPQG